MYSDNRPSPFPQGNPYDTYTKPLHSGTVVLRCNVTWKMVKGTDNFRVSAGQDLVHCTAFKTCREMGCLQSL